jgi:hypothetical protein
VRLDHLLSKEQTISLASLTSVRQNKLVSQVEHDFCDDVSCTPFLIYLLFAIASPSDDG